MDFIEKCLNNKAVVDKILLVSDGEPITTKKLFISLYRAFGIRSRLFYLPSFFLYFIANLLGKKDQIDRLYNSLVINSNETKLLLDWYPPYSFDEGIKLTVDWFKTL